MVEVVKDQRSVLAAQIACIADGGETASRSGYNINMALYSSKTPSRVLLEEITARILSVAKPSRVVLFGSGARGAMGKDSDLDILVIVREPVHRRQLAQKIDRTLHGLGVPVDILVATEADVKKYGHLPGTILKPALRDGRVLYEA
jgi:predicted nucleotidyltransferase